LACFLVMLVSTFWVEGRRFGVATYNQVLKSRLALQEERVQSLETQLGLLSDRTSLINRRFGLPAPDPSLLALSVGGPVHQDSILLNTVPGSRLVEKLLRQTTELHAVLGENLHYLENMEEHVRNKLIAWRHVPSVLPTQGRFTSPFGYRRHPVTGETKMHEGVDIANEAWTPVLATADGKVAEVSFGPFYGNYVRIEHDNGYSTVFAHMNQVAIAEGEAIHRYQLVGYMGATGRTTGTHVHYEVRIDGQPVNPNRFTLSAQALVD
jgi:murein DD-endopeptidase MepM/ murein hydrolase activator NlpD